MTNRKAKTSIAWVRRVRESLRTRGYYYELEFCADGDTKLLVTAGYYKNALAALA